MKIPQRRTLSIAAFAAAAILALGVVAPMVTTSTQAFADRGHGHWGHDDHWRGHWGWDDDCCDDCCC